MKRFSFTKNNIMLVEGLELYCYGEEKTALTRIVSSFTPGSIYTIISAGLMAERRDSVAVESDFGPQYIDGIKVFDNISSYMLPLCLLTDKERFLFKLSGLLPERFDEYVK